MKVVSMFLGTLVLALFLGAKVYAAPVKELTLQPDSKVEFLAIGNPSLLKIRGEGAKASGKLKMSPDEVSGEIVVQLKPLDTGMSLRNRHMHQKYLKTEEFPEAKLVLDAIKVPAGDFSEQKIAFTGKLQIQKETKPISGEATLSRNADKISGVAQFSIKLDQFSIDIPSFAGITVANEVKITSEILAQ